MDTFLSAVLADLISRSVSFLTDRYYRSHKNGVEENLQKLRHMLLRIQVIIEEAEGRSITNQAMLQQLEMLREATYKGCYLFDTFKYRILQQERGSDQDGAHSLALSKFIPCNRRPLCHTRDTGRAFQVEVNELQKMLGSLHGIIDNMMEFVVFLKSYPHISRGPRSKYLFMEKCMFGRHAEMEKIATFLLQPEPPPGAKILHVLPIVGPPRVGKTTLVEHVCYDERVRDHFSSIILCSGDIVEGSGVVKHQSHGVHARSLVIMELADDLVLDKTQRKRFYSSTRHMPSGSKVIITSRSASIMKLGTTRALIMRFLPQEAFWYFFKVLAFGSINHEEHPELASLAMEIAAELDGSFIGAQCISRLLRANTQTWYWRKILELERNNAERNVLLFGDRTHGLLHKNQSAYFWSMSKTFVSFKGRYSGKNYQQTEVSKIMLHEVRTGSAEAHGNFEAIAWKSCIPPYHSFLMSCEVETPQRITDRKKRPHSMV